MPNPTVGSVLGGSDRGAVLASFVVRGAIDGREVEASYREEEGSVEADLRLVDRATLMVDVEDAMAASAARYGIDGSPFPMTLAGEPVAMLVTLTRALDRLTHVEFVLRPR